MRACPCRNQPCPPTSLPCLLRLRLPLRWLRLLSQLCPLPRPFRLLRWSLRHRRLALRPLRWLIQTRADAFLRDLEHVRRATDVAERVGARLALYLVGFESFSDAVGFAHRAKNIPASGGPVASRDGDRVEDRDDEIDAGGEG